MPSSPGTGLSLEAAVLGGNVDNAARGHAELRFFFLSACVQHTALLQKS